MSLRLSLPRPAALERPAIAVPSLDALEIGFLIVFAGFVAMAWLGLTLAELGLDRPVIVLAIGSAGVLAAVAGAARRPWRPVPRWHAAAMGGLLALGLALDLPPDEWILGDLDPGSYVNAGATIARSGAIVLQDPLLAGLPPAVHASLFPFPASRLPGFYLTTARWVGLIPRGWMVPLDRVVPHGFHLYPAVLAFGYAAGGVRAELLVTPLLAIFALLGFYLLARRLFGAPVGFIAAVLLAISPAEVWFARYPAAEILAQVLLFGGFLAFVAMLDRPSPVLAALAGAGLGAVHLAKIETLPLPFLLAGFFGYQALVGRFDRRWWPFLIVYAFLLAQAGLHAAIFASWYAATSFGKALSLRVLLAGALASLVIVALAAFLWLRADLRARLGAALDRSGWPRLVAMAGPILIGAAAAYAYYLRPLGAVLPPGGKPTPEQIALANQLDSFVRLGWYVAPLGLLLGVAGWMLIVQRVKDRRAVLPLLLIAADTLLFLYRPDITPIHYWTARRWITLVIPGFCLAAAYLLVSLFPGDAKLRAPRMEALVPLAFGLVLVLEQVPALSPLLGYVEYRGAVSQLSALAATLPPDAVVLFPDGDAGRRFSTPLNYLFDRTSVLVLDNPDSKTAAASAARLWAAEGRPVYWVELADRPGPSEVGLRGSIVSRQKVSLVEKLATSDRPPGPDGLFQQDLAVWKVGP